MSELLWWLFAPLALGGALGTVTQRNPVASLLSLVLTFFGLAAIYILLGAHFIGAIQVIVYAGAIMVLFLFVIMLLNLGHDFRSDLREVGWIAAGSLVAGAAGFLAFRAIAPEAGDLLAESAPAASTTGAENAVAVIAEPMFREFLVPFELTSILLLVAVIGAVILAKRRI